MPSNHLILCRSILLLPSIFLSIRAFSNELILHIRWPKFWSVSFSISPSKEYPGLISFRIDWFDLLAVQGALKSLLQHHNLKASILWHSVFFMVQLSHPYMTAGKTIALTRRTFISKMMPLLFNMLSRLVIAFLPRSKHLLILWLQSPSAVILEPQKINSPSVCHAVMGPDAMILVLWMLSFKPTFSLSLSPSSRGFWVPLHFISTILFSNLSVNFSLPSFPPLFLAAAKSLQSCPTLCDPLDGSPPGSSVPGILQARTLEWVAISFSNAWKWKVKSLSHVRLLATPCSPPGSSIHGIFQARVLEWGAIAFSDCFLDGFFYSTFSPVQIFVISF